MLKRARDLQCFVAWCKADDWWPLDEKKLLEYVTWTEQTGKSKLIGKNLKHALRFFRHVMGAHFDEDEVLGPVFKGRVGRVGATKSAKVQARALTVNHRDKDKGDQDINHRRKEDHVYALCRPGDWTFGDCLKNDLEVSAGAPWI